jgi:glycylpeptide N-tetradecanoyltransferase
VVETLNGKITDFISFYSLPSTVLHTDPHSRLEAAYGYYTVPGESSLASLYKDALIMARNLGFDVFNVLEIMQNASIIEDLKFGPGDGSLHYYFYNWRLGELQPGEVGMILV